ncbi:hypothetical protein [Blautia sp.]|uniref:hypothetical protein n=2 Tax=Blautia TaxID=572511 RepID=UPI00257C7DF7|nr:hypothetical protein [Blautia sp.]
MLFSSFSTRSMVFAYFAKAQLPFSLFRDLFNDTAEFTLCYGLHDCSHLFQGYFIHSLSTLYYYNAPSLTTRLTGDYRDRTYTGKCSPALLDTRKKGSGIAGFLIFLVISSVIGKLLDLIPVLKSMELTFVLYIAASFAIAAVLYVISGWIMEKKLSV